MFTVSIFFNYFFWSVMMTKYFFYLMLGTAIFTNQPVYAMDPPLADCEPTTHPTIRLEKNIFQEAELNLMWLNPEYSPNQVALFPSNLNEVNTKYAIGWISKNRDLKTPINFWYDSEVTSKESLEYTRNAINAGLRILNPDLPIEGTFTYCDIWQIDYVRAHKTAFCHKHPAPFRSDLGRMAVLLREAQARYRSYFDLNIPSVSLVNLFTDEKAKVSGGTILKETLDRSGFALAKNNAPDHRFYYENSFLALDSQHEIAVQALKFGVLEINTLRGEYFLENDCWSSTNDKIDLIQIVFGSFRRMLPYYMYLKGGLGIDDVPEKMPRTLKERIEIYSSPKLIFSDKEQGTKIKFMYEKIVPTAKYLGPRWLSENKHPQYGAITNGYAMVQITHQCSFQLENCDFSQLVIQVNKPISGLYNK